MKNKIVLLLLLFSVLWITQCSPAKQKEKVIIFHAGSLSYPLKALIEAFNTEHPDIEIISEAAGSLATARKVTELKRKADILALADYQIVDRLLIPDYANFNIHFASNSIGLAYTEHSHYAETINPENWLEILKKPEVKIGASDPDADPCGYRTRMLLQLAEKTESQENLIDELFTPQKLHQRPKETDLIALLETKTIDYIFLYESVSRQHGLKFLALSDSVNLSQPTLNKWYKNAALIVRGSEEGSKIQLEGEAIVYGLTVLKDAPNKTNAYFFLQWMLNPDKGLKTIRDAGLTPVIPLVITHSEPLEKETQQFKY
jgi:molybdate/tungstate transport system substrate-binding protein